MLLLSRELVGLGAEELSLELGDDRLRLGQLLRFLLKFLLRLGRLLTQLPELFLQLQSIIDQSSRIVRKLHQQFLGCLQARSASRKLPLKG